jgi:benzodiazapine receptor
MGQFLSVAIAIGLPVAAGVGVGLSLKDDVKGWYKTLRKPSWTPPDWLFGPVWTALYTAMGYASYLVWKEGGGSLPLTLYGIQLVMNLAWSPLFFKKHEIGFALLDITALLGVLGATIVQFNKVSPTASYLLLPYLAWTSYATALTASIYKKNPQARGSQSKKARKQVEDAANTVSDKASELASSVGDKASELADRVQGKSNADKAEDKAEEAKDKTKDAASDAKGAVKDAGNSASEKSKRAGDKASDAASDAKGAAKDAADDVGDAAIDLKDKAQRKLNN